MPALQPYIIEPIWEQFCAVLLERKTDRPLGRHRPRIPDHLVFEKLIKLPTIRVSTFSILGLLSLQGRKAAGKAV